LSPPLLAVGLLFLAQSPAATTDAGTTPRPNEARAEGKIVTLEHELGGRIGFVAIDTATLRSIEHRAHERFAMCSTFKWLLAADVLTHALGNKPDFSLEKRIPYGEADLIGHAPTTRAQLKVGALSIAVLVDAAVEVSDNTAANLLLRVIGGPEGLTAWLRRMKDEETRLDRNEPSLNTNLPGDPRDTTTPAASAMDLSNFLLGEALPAPAREHLKAAMERSQTGAARLRAGLPSDWRVADKTGTCGERGAVNDVAVIWPKGHAPVVMAAYLSDSALPVAKLEAAHAQLARIAVEALLGEAISPP
jgi:beta-lactamase class A